MRIDAAQLINQTSGSVEWYTPRNIVDRARDVMGSIDLDPASCELANRTVNAVRYYTADDNGLFLPWFGNVWMNHPFGRSHNESWINRLVTEYRHGSIEQACCITFASTSERWFQPLLQYPVCFVSPRVNYLGADGRPVRGVTKGSSVAYLGSNVERFIDVFGKIGAVMLPARMSLRATGQAVTCHEHDRRGVA